MELISAKNHDDVISKLYERLENDNLALGHMYRKKGKMSETLEKDFDKFCEVMRETFEESPNNFSFNKVYGRIPKNKWIKKHHEYMLFLSNHI